MFGQLATTRLANVDQGPIVVAPDRPHLLPMRRPLLALALALAATAASVGYQRVGPTARVEGEGFCPGPEPCLVPALGGGFPLPYLVDDPQVSVPNALFLAEDDLRWGPFAVDLAAYFVVALGALALRGRPTRDPPGP